MHPLLRAFVLLLALALPHVARAAEPLAGIRSLGMGNTLRAAATGAEGTLLNPSGIALVRQYAVTAFYSLHLSPLGHGVHVSVADSVTQRRIAMALYYSFVTDSLPVSFRVTEGPPEDPGRDFPIRDHSLTRMGHEVGVLSAFPLGDRFSLGITTKYGHFSTTSQLPPEQLEANPPFNARNPAINKDRVFDLGSVNNVVSFDIGVTVRIYGGLSLGLVGQNLWGHGHEMPTQLGTGLAYVMGQRLTIAADATVNFTGYKDCVGMGPSPCLELANRTTVRSGAGLEYSFADRVPVRAGYMFDSSLFSHHVSFGIGYFSPRWAIDAGVRQRVGAGIETVMLVGVRIFRD